MFPATMASNSRFKPILWQFIPRTKVGNDLERTALASALEFERLLLPLQIVLLVATGNAGKGDRLTLSIRLSPKQTGTQSSKDRSAYARQPYVWPRSAKPS
jgi:hypothetical protein